MGSSLEKVYMTFFFVPLVREAMFYSVDILAGQRPWGVAYDDTGDTHTVEQLFYFFRLTQSVDNNEVPFGTIVHQHVTRTVLESDRVLFRFKDYS